MGTIQEAIQSDPADFPVRPAGLAGGRCAGLVPDPMAVAALRPMPEGPGQAAEAGKTQGAGGKPALEQTR